MSNTINVNYMTRAYNQYQQKNAAKDQEKEDTRFADSVREKSEASGSIVGNSKIGSVSAKDMTMVEYKQYIYNKISQIPMHPTRAGESISVTISEAGFEAMKNDPEYEAWVLNDLGNGRIPFASWPLDLLMDYILKIHHRGIRARGPELLALLEKVERVHGEAHPELHELKALVSESLEDLEMHLQKEENVLFPYLYELYAAKEQGQRMAPMHCGTIANPIRVMKMEHEGEGNRYLHIIQLTNHFSVPQDGCASYRLLMQELEAFVDALFEHIHLENNLLFPRFEEIEQEIVC